MENNMTNSAQANLSLRMKIRRTLGVALAWGALLPGLCLGQRQMERLDRGVVAVPQTNGTCVVSWRLLVNDPEDVRFNLYREEEGGQPAKLNATPIDGPTFFIDTAFPAGRACAYSVRPVTGGGERAADGAFTVAVDAPRGYLEIALQRREGYKASDGSVGDLDGDGQYELVLMQASRPRDNSHAGETDPPILQGYEFDGTLLWEINLGRNIREGAHYTQFMVYDLDGDGRAEIVCKTADGTVDGAGKTIGDAAADWRNRSGYILKGPEFLTVFDGRTGAALATTAYIPPRHPDTLEPTSEQLKAMWGDGYGNRMDRFLACVAYLDGKRPSVVVCRGYYTRSVLAAWDWRDGALTTRWVFDSDAGAPGNRGYRGQGNHNLSVADVDGDGRDEIVYGAMVVDDNGTGLHSTGLGHGDALHVGDLDPERPGLEIFMPQENVNGNGGIGASFRDARTGTLLWTTPAKKDVGRAMAADIDPRHPGAECWALNSGTLYTAKGAPIGDRPGSVNFGIWWTGGLLRDLLDHRGAEREWHGAVMRWNWEQAREETVWEDPDTRSNNWTKGNPVLSGDLFGDWREEMIWRTADGAALRLYTTPHPTRHRIATLMHDPQYRLAIAWQNVAYNQPPHPGFFLGEGMAPPPRPRIVLPPERP